ncbi:MAG: Uma2 family endonuclease [Firmicutes bacterium]|nr:Uma2 family endonuclease [Bacillota bacterium]
MATRTLLTADDLLRLPKDGKRYELVKGELVEMAPPGCEHGEIAGRIAALLGSFVLRQGLGAVLVEAGFLLTKNPDTVRAPDVAFVAREHLPSPRPKGYHTVSPDVAVESLSPNDTFREVQERIEAWLSAGAKSVWLVDPDRRRVMVYAHPHRPQVFEAAETLADPAVPGFSVQVAELFPEG